MAEKLTSVLVIDLEATCWEKNDQAHKESEIIEIGLTVVSPYEPACILENKSILVKPTTTEINDFCTQLTSITPEMVEKDGISFFEACDLLKDKYRSKRYTWASWGDYDRRQFERQCRRENISYPFGPTHLNVKNLFALFANLDRERGMAEALQKLEIPLEGKHHRGVDDSKNIAKILCYMMNCTRRAFDEDGVQIGRI